MLMMALVGAPSSGGDVQEMCRRRSNVWAVKLWASGVGVDDGAGAFFVWFCFVERAFVPGSEKVKFG